MEDHTLTRTCPKPSSDLGFSLLETLFALVIMSIASLALFQSTSSMLSVSDRAVKASETVLQETLSDKAATQLLTALVPGWPEDRAFAFIGEPTSLKGVSSAAIDEAPGLQGFTLSLSEESLRDARFTNLIYSNLERKTFSREQNASQSKAPLTLKRNLPSDTRFFYLGIDGIWHPKWPPEQMPVTPFFNDKDLIQPSSLPEGIKLETPNKVVSLMIDIHRQSDLPTRMDIARNVQ